MHKTYSVDNEICGRWEEFVKSQGKNYSELLEEYMRREIDNYECRLTENSATASTISLSIAASTIPTPSASGEFEQTINQRIEPLLNKDNTQLTVEDKGMLDTILISAKKLVGKVETKLSLLRIVRFSKISNIDRLEMTRLAQLKSAKVYQEKKQCFNLMQELPFPVEEVQTQDKTQIETNLSEAQLWSLQQSEERRQKKLRMPDTPPLTTTTTSEPENENEGEEEILE